MSVGIQLSRDQVVIAVDPHKGSWTAAAVDASLQPLASIRVPVSREGYRALRRFARRWPDVGWAVEGATGVGAADRTVARRRHRGPRRAREAGHPGAGAFDRTRARNNDDADAVSVGSRRRCLAHAEHRPTDPPPRRCAPGRSSPTTWSRPTRTPLNRPPRGAHPPGAWWRRTTDCRPAADLLRGLRVRDPAAKTLRALATDLISEVRQLDRRITKAANDIQTAVTASGTALTDLYGVGTLTAAKILAHIGDVRRFRSAAAFASYTDTAPIEASCGEVIRHRLSRAGNRQLNCCLHVVAIIEVRQNTPGRSYYLRKRSEGKSHNEALRCLKRRLSDVVYCQLIHGANTQKAGPGGHSGAALSSRAAG